MKYPYGKIDLHLHLDGSVRPATAWALAKEQNISLPVADYEQCQRMMRVGRDCRSLLSYFSSFQIPSMVLHDERALRRVTEELAEDLLADGVVYGEIRFAPQLHNQKGMSQQRAVEAVMSGIESAARKHPELRLGLILCALCGEDPAQYRRANWETLRLAQGYKRQNVAFDLAGGEGLSPIRAYRELFEEAARQGVPFTVHAGEAGGADHVREVLSWGASRIGHGCRALESREVMRLLRDAAAVLEMCPTSNVQTGAQPSYAEHAIRQFFDEGIRVTVNTDNRTCSGTTLEREYALLQTHLGFALDELRRMNGYALDAAFLPDEMKTGIKARI